MIAISPKKNIIQTQKILGQLISFPVLGGESNSSIAQWIENYLTEHSVKFYNVPNEEGNKRSIHCRIGPAVDGGVILSGHTDVVPVEGQDWHSNPFEMIEKGGKLYGRGSCDMKGFIACCLAALPKMVAADLKKPIYFAFSYDEEVGCWAGPALAKSIVDTYEEKPRFAIIGEPTNMQTVTAEKGMGSYQTTVYSRPAHSSQIRSEVSAITVAAKLTIWLENKMEALIKSGQVDERFNPPHTTMQVGIFNGGTAHNIVAEKCNFTWDLRSIPSDSIPLIYAEFEAKCQELIAEAKLKVPTFEIHTQSKFPPIDSLDTPTDAAVVTFVNQINDEITTNAVSYASEAGQFAAEGFETVLCGPGSIEQAHRADEFIEISQLELGVQFIERLITVSSK